MPIWEFIPLGAYKCPPAPLSKAVGRGVRALWERFREASPQKPPHIGPEHSVAPPSAFVRALTPQFDPAEGVDALDAVVQQAGWGEGSRQALVGPPGSEAAAILTHWAERGDVELAAPPSVEEILAGDEGWAERFDEQATVPLVAPNLERFFLRHSNGLALLRGLLAWMWRTRRPVLIGCDSWAWSFLVRSLPMQALFGTCHALHPYGEEVLGQWFADSLARDEAPRSCRLIGSGASVLPCAGDEGEKEASEHAYDAGFLKWLASWSRGIPQIALAGWRQGLCLAPDDVEEDGGAACDLARLRAIWVEEPTSLRLPNIPSRLPREAPFVLHALLVHAGLAEETLTRVLPFARLEIVRCLALLQAARVIETCDDAWRVAPLAYPQARWFLEGEGFIVDQTH